MSVTLTFPDGTTRDYAAGVTGTDVATSIFKSLAKKTVAMRLDGDVRDLADEILTDASIELVLRDDEEALELIRHDCAHVLAEAVQELWPDTQVTIGPVIEDGFYYDFARDESFTTQELAEIEKKMRQIIERGAAFCKKIVSRNDAIEIFKARGEHYKVDLVKAIPPDQDVKIYHQGQWFDLCRGPHMPTTKYVGTAFKLMKVAGAYWRGDSDNAMLSRIYGTAWANDKDLKAYLHRLEEAQKRDHRRLGREMNLFHLQEEAPGQIFWHPDGWQIYTILMNYMRRMQSADDYEEINTPEVIDRALWEASGHWDKYQENMFIVEVDEDHAREKAMNALKPMNCPGHVQVFNQGLKSYRDLPLRFCEFGACHRYEPSGALYGTMRVRGFTQDDGHIFCAMDQIESETKKFIAFLAQVYADLGFENWIVKLSTRPEKRIGSDETWDTLEKALGDACKAAGCAYELLPGEGAFYGPKLEFTLTDAIGRHWQCGTLQVDTNMPQRLGAHYIGQDGNKHVPVMLHRATLGSFERFIGILIEQYAGRFPLWLAPVQVVVATIVSEAEDYAQHVAHQLKAKGVRVKTDFRNEKINYKIREHSVQKVPAIFVIGKKEAEEQKVSIRRLGTKDQTILGLKEAVANVVAEGVAPDLR